MAGNSFGQLFKVTTFGESHGCAIGCVVDGCPPGLPLTEADLQVDLDRRKPGSSQFTTQRKEPDQVKIISGVFEGVTTGTPIALLIENQDQRSQDYSKIKDLFRPNHADYTYAHKYGVRDYRGGGRASARETAMRVAAGAIARKFLRSKGIEITGWLSQVGNIKTEQFDIAEIRNNPFFCPDTTKIPEMEALINRLQEESNSVGAKVSVMATGVPVGLGEPVYDRLDADLARALMSINAVKGVEIGDGFAAVSQFGTEHRDEMTPEGFLSNHSGGVMGGISTGQDVIAHMALKPTSSIATTGRAINVRGEAVTVETNGRHDPCVGLRAVPIAEAMMALTLMDHFMRHRAQNAEVVSPIPVV